jgi:hypothetical protein
MNNILPIAYYHSLNNQNGCLNLKNFYEQHIGIAYYPFT